jgi:hypothetical protein
MWDRVVGKFGISNIGIYLLVKCMYKDKNVNAGRRRKFKVVEKVGPQLDKN